MFTIWLCGFVRSEITDVYYTYTRYLNHEVKTLTLYARWAHLGWGKGLNSHDRTDTYIHQCVYWNLRIFHFWRVLSTTDTFFVWIKIYWSVYFIYYNELCTSRRMLLRRSMKCHMVAFLKDYCPLFIIHIIVGNCPYTYIMCVFHSVQFGPTLQ